MRVWRICARRHLAHALDGEGARRFGGRWNPPGVPVVYTAGSLALAILELLVQVEVDVLPGDLMALPVEVPDAIRIRRLRSAQLPGDWAAYPAPASVQAVGAAWARDADTAVLAVPSAVVPQEWNYLLNPAHRDMRGIRAGRPERLRLDARLPLRRARVSASRPPRRTS